MTTGPASKLPPEAVRAVADVALALQQNAIAAMLKATDMNEVARAQGAIQALTDLINRVSRS